MLFFLGLAILPFTLPSVLSAKTEPLSHTEASYLRRSFALAESSRRKGSHPFGAVLVCEGRPFLDGENEVAIDDNPMRHAEMVLLENFVKYRQASSDARRKIAPTFAGRLPRIEECQMYASTHPCQMCEGAIYTMRVGSALKEGTQVFYGLSKEGLSQLVHGHKKPERTVRLSGPHLFSEAQRPHLGFWN